MVLKPSDYQLPSPGTKIDPTNPTSAASKLAGMTVALTGVLFAYQFAKNRGVSFIDKYAGRVGLSTSGQENSPWGGW